LSRPQIEGFRDHQQHFSRRLTVNCARTNPNDQPVLVRASYPW